MLTLALVPLTCWLCALLALPRRPRLGNQVEVLAYARHGCASPAREAPYCPVPLPMH